MITQRPAKSTLMAIEDLLQLPSAHQLMRPHGKRSVADALPDIDRLTPRYRSLHGYMAERELPYPLHVGPANVVLRSYGNIDLTPLAFPDELDSTWFGNGHHRLSIAIELGWTHIFATPDLFYSGAEYKHLRGRTPKVFQVTRDEAMELFPEANARTQKWESWATAQFEAAGWGHLIS
jgi:hypothetical protein